ncbi:gluconate 5-dehydrogenase [Burkholderia sp. SFA1]|uniref:SDR family NAD(P)-dependent oxidoreductase n=1 Tax=Caballeronia sp. CLC5 TaxID=2906764 RepID=UPI001F2685E8|nr:SDR family oxidoreductase [Caballeronia sp. CLC5]MCE4573906.1 SDR family oxidoreductase [Caballeronia sp. CLC5]BBQ00752.1 gluconate 5-dehydrogenase [Burkholderia sp. SFA1]
MSTSRKVVVVTGASRGIGAAIVRAFRRLDYAIVATSRSIEPSADANVLTVAGDIADPAVAQRVMTECIARFGRIDTLVNNAGIYIGKAFTEHTAEDLAAVMNVNMKGFFHMTQLALVEMDRQSSGHVVSVTASIADTAYSGVYSALAALTKGGLNAATKSLAIEFAHKGIRVNAVAPGIVRTPMHAVDMHDALGTVAPLGRIGEASDIADAILYLDRAPFITGEILHVDGGLNAGR